MKDNIVQNKSYQFSLKMIELYKYLAYERKEFVLSRQVLRSGTAIGANIEEAIGGFSEKDFLAKMSIAYKEARETHYWLRLLRDSNFINIETAENYIFDCEEICKILGKIQITIKSKNNN